MLRPIALLVLLASCGGVCVGCSDTPGDGDEIPEAFTARVSGSTDCDGSGMTVNIVVTGARGAAPVLSRAGASGELCGVAEDLGDSWVIHCQGDGPAGMPGGGVTWREIEILKTLDGGSYTHGGMPCGERSAAVTSITVP